MEIKVSAERKEKLQAIRQRIIEARQKAGRKAREVQLLAVSKTKPWEMVAEFLLLGQCAFGENYVQEALEKQEAIRSWLDTCGGDAPPEPEWHLIGTLQSNKAKFLPDQFVLFHGLDNLALAEKINQKSEEKKTLTRALVEINLDTQSSKGGISISDLPQFLENAAKLQSLRITGLMAIPNPESPDTISGKNFAKLREILNEANKNSWYRTELFELSMGMSHDFELAISEGATIVRVGTALFGERT
jgi:pyridoxal phosphate enzyme (YggS family)